MNSLNSIHLAAAAFYRTLKREVILDIPEILCQSCDVLLCQRGNFAKENDDPITGVFG